MALSDLMREVKSLSSDELEALYLFVQDQRQYRRLTEQEPEETDRHPAPLDMDDLKQIFAELRDGFSEHDLEELDWAVTTTGSMRAVRRTDETGESRSTKG